MVFTGSLIATLGFFGVATYNKLTLIGETLIEIKFKVVEQDSRIKQDELIFNYLRADVDELKAIINKTSADKEYHALVVH